ncbi:endospore germination permease [Paenibacillus sp. IB182496]|uniref:Endospore germination permease n=1 Tax=Paenibacillus sabuli TaxID=2772509 RepID=A0A927BWJ6_9BACL|nr:endospore germination permease [Paenibacillus sabuli]MBD2846774.1 endospore germination permease [Paenibacillus sabuli]
MNRPATVTTLQAAALVAGSIIGVGVLPLPRVATLAADTGGPLVTGVAVLAAWLALWLITKLGTLFPQQSIFQYSEILLGRWLAAIGTLLLICFFAFLASLAAREFGEVVVTAVLRKTPLEMTVLAMLLLAAIAARNDVRTFSYIHMFYLPFILAPGILIIALSLKNAVSLNLLPLWGNDATALSVTHGILTIASLFQVAFVVTIVIPHMKQPQKALKASSWGVVIAGGLYVAIVLATIAVFGSEETRLLIWPTLELAKTTSLPANILERLDAAFLAIWVTAVFTTLLSTYYLTIHAISQLFRLKDHRLLTYFVLPFIFWMAMLPQSVLQLYQIVELVGRIGLCITFGYPIILLLVWLLRRRGVSSS